MIMTLIIKYIILLITFLTTIFIFNDVRLFLFMLIVVFGNLLLDLVVIISLFQKEK